MRPARRGAAFALALAGLSAAILLLWALFAQGPRSSRADWPERFESNGERLYFTGTSERGTRLVASGGDHHMMMMRGGACVACHGADRQGGRLRPRFWKVAPPVTPEAFAGGHEGEDGHEHLAYTEATLARAITDGLEPDGERLDSAMPRWSMSPADLEDLLDFLIGNSYAQH